MIPQPGDERANKVGRTAISPFFCEIGEVGIDGNPPAKANTLWCEILLRNAF
jgi:hypothetical protein